MPLRSLRCNPIFQELVISGSLWLNGSAPGAGQPPITMIPKSPNTPDGENSLPPRHRPQLNDLADSTTESGLWDLDDISEPHDDPKDPLYMPKGGWLPESRQRLVIRNVEEPPKDVGEKAAPARQEVRVNIGKAQPFKQSGSISIGRSMPAGQSDDLELWDDDEVAAESQEPPAPEPAAPEPAAPAVPEEPASVEQDSSEAESVPSESQPPAVGDHASMEQASPPQVQPVSLRPRLKLSAGELIGMVALLAVLLTAGVGFYVFTIKRLPAETERAETTDFPIKGGKVTVKAANTYWREPVTDGVDADTFRRGTRLLPVVEMSVEGSGALRVMFLDEQRQFVGDAVTRAVGGQQTISIPATAGFEDTGTYAAYRIGSTRPWTVIVYEAGSASALGSAFELLFEMNISTERR